MANQPGSNPYRVLLEQAVGDLTACIQAIHRIGVDVDQASHHLAWRGGSADHFHQHAGRQHHHLHMNNDRLRTLRRYLDDASHLKVHDATRPTTPAGVR